jgi:hypothetical protein
MKQLKWSGWALVAAGLLFAGRERLAAERLAERASAPATAASGGENTALGSFFDVSKGTTTTVWLDVALGTVPPLAPAPSKRESAAASRPEPFHWIDAHSGPSVVKTAAGGHERVRAQHGAGVLVDSRGRRWEIQPPPSTAAALGDAAPPSGAPAAPGAARALARVDPAEIQSRRENSLNALKCSGAVAAALLLW